MTQHYFSVDPQVASRPAPVRIALRGVDVEVLSDRGVFAYRHLDRGTELLLRSVPDPPSGELLDLGSGYGAIAVTMALLAPTARVWAVDINRRALELAARNAASAGLGNVVAVPPEEVPADIRFAAIYSNPPVRLGKQPLHALLAQWLTRLDGEATAHLVVQRHLGADTLAAWLAEVGYTVQRARARQGYRLLQVRGGGATHHDGDRAA